MKFVATVFGNRIELPTDLQLPDGTEVEITLSVKSEKPVNPNRPIHLPTFRGDGLQPGIDLTKFRE